MNISLCHLDLILYARMLCSPNACLDFNVCLHEIRNPGFCMFFLMPEPILVYVCMSPQILISIQMFSARTAADTTFMNKQVDYYMVIQANNQVPDLFGSHLHRERYRWEKGRKEATNQFSDIHYLANHSGSIYIFCLCFLLLCL